MIDVARLAGVSATTVSRYINGRAGIRGAARASVAAAIASLDFIPNLAARKLALAKDFSVGLLYSSINPGPLSEMLIGANEQARRASVPLLIQCCEPGRPQDEIVQALIRRGVTGVILPPPLCDMPEVRTAFKGAGITMVLLASAEPPGDAPSVGIDEVGAAREMTDHLIDLGHHRIGFAVGDPSHTINALRLRGYREGLVNRGITVDDRLIKCGLSGYQQGRDATRRLLSSCNPPTAIFASNDLTAAAVIAAAHSRGLDVPGDLTVVSFEDSTLATAIWPDLTAICQPFAKMAGRAVELLIGTSYDATSPATLEMPRELFDFTLIRRRSDAAPRRKV